jgi:RNA polymerase sigma-70 factor (ECF subfamily)
MFHGGEFRNSLYTIPISLNRNRLRSLARRPAGRRSKMRHPGPWGAGSRRKDIERALHDAADGQPAALLLVVLEGLPYREVAEVQGVPIVTVMSSCLARARGSSPFLHAERPTLRRAK